VDRARDPSILNGPTAQRAVECCASAALSCSARRPRQPASPSIGPTHNIGGIPNRNAAAVAVLGLIPGTVRKLSGEVKVPHIGWNDVIPVSPSPLFPDPKESPVTYFVHSFYVGMIPQTVAVTEYGVRFSASVQKGNVYGVQFHPEKSQVAGLNLLRRFTLIKPTAWGE